MNDKIRTVLEGTPDKPPRSKLEPHQDIMHYEGYVDLIVPAFRV